MSEASHVFITGMPRSGTTLLDKLLSTPACSQVYSQPLPLLFSEIKRSYLDQLGRTAEYPLNDMQLSNYYDPEDWLGFLEHFEIDAAYFDRVATAMRSFSGQYTKPDDVADFIQSLSARTTDSFIASYLSWLDSNRHQLIGLKETWCEEYLPFLVAKGFKCLLILRDPRDVITSLNYGRGRGYGGNIKPLLYNIRSWRKSVAFSLKMGCNPDFMAIRYEDLVTDPEPVLARVFEFLSLQAAETKCLTGAISDQHGQPWKSNSSHGEREKISAESVGKYTEYLSPAMVNLVEALCFPEMTLLGYHNNLSPCQLERALSSARNSEELERPELARYLWSSDRCDEETQRIRLLLAGEYQPQYFLFERAFQQLGNALRRL